MLSADGGNETDEAGAPRVSHGVDRGPDTAESQDFDTQPSVSKKRKAALGSGDSVNLVRSRGADDLELECEEFQRIAVEVENLKYQLDKDVKELGYCEENEKLRVELALNSKEMQCLKAQNYELRGKIEGLHKNIVEILENQIGIKNKNLLEFKKLQSTMELNASLACNQDSSSELLDENVAQKSCSNREADGEKSKRLELEVEKLDAKIQGKMKILNEMLEREKFSEDSSSVTVRKYIQTNMELQDARRELIAGVKDMKGRSGGIGIRSLGELNVNPFEDACRMKHEDDEPDIKAVMLLITWHYKLMQPSWSPFKTVEADGITKEVVDDDDPELKQLLAEYGGDVCGAVKTALKEMNEHNPGRRYAVPELWNFDEGRKATLKEGMKYMCRKLKGKQKSLKPCHLASSVVSSDSKKAKPHSILCRLPSPSGLHPQQPCVPAGDGYETCTPRGTCSSISQDVDGGATAGQNLGTKEGSRKRKPAARSRDSNKLVRGRGLEVKCDDTWRISLEIENLRSQLGEENVKLMVEMDLKDTEVQCLRKENKEMQAKYNELKIKYMNQNEEFRYDKQNVEQELQTKYEKQNEELQTKFKKQNKDLQSNYEKQEELLAKYENMNEELQAKFDKQNKDMQSNYKKKNEDMQAKYEKKHEELEATYRKQDEELQAKYEKQNKEMQTMYEKQNKELQAKYKNQNQVLEAKYEKKNEELQSKYEKQKQECQAMNENQKNEELKGKLDGLHKGCKLKIVQILENQIDDKRKQLWLVECLWNNMEFTLAHLEGKGIPKKSFHEDLSFKLVSESLAEKNCINGSAADEKLKRLEMEVANLDRKIQMKTKMLGEMLECEKFSKELCSIKAWKPTVSSMALDDIRKGLIKVMIGTESDVILEESLELDPAWLPYIFDESFPSGAPECSSAKSQQCDTKHAGLSSTKSPHKGSMSAREMQDTTCMNAETTEKTPKEETNEYKTRNAGFTDDDEDNIESVCAEEFHSDLDEGNIEYVSAETEFHKFSETNLLQKFSVGQIWALYSDVDMFPNYYAVIYKVDLQNGKLQVRWLDACPQGEQEKKLLQKGRPIAYGTFKVSGINDMTTYRNTDSFSHPVLARTTGEKGEYEIIPGVGEIWAIYRNWRTGWTAQDYEKCEYELVEIFGHSDTSTHVKLLRKVDGHTAVFMPCQGEGSVKTISKDEYLKFSHQIPCFHLTHEKGGKLRGCLELDPFSLPDEFLTTNSE